MQITVRLGQTVSTLAQRYHSSVAAIAAANGLSNPDKIRIGQHLIIPDGKDRPVARAGRVPHDRFTASKRRVLEQPRGAEHGRAPNRTLPTPHPRVAAPAAPAAPGHRSTLSAADVDALTRAVAAEARGESPTVWAGIAQTIINYARKTGTSISHLTRSSYLSSNLDGNRRFYSMPLGHIPNAEGIREAVLAAGEGRSRVGARSHFYDTSIGMPSWGDRASRVQIGHVVFLDSK